MYDVCSYVMLSNDDLRYEIKMHKNNVFWSSVHSMTKPYEREKIKTVGYVERQQQKQTLQTYINRQKKNESVIDKVGQKVYPMERNIPCQQLK